MFKNRSSLSLVLVLSLLALALQSCATMFSGPAPGTVGFYQVDATEGKVKVSNVMAKRVHRPGDFFFVYRVDADKVVVGFGGSDKEKPAFDEIATGVVMSPKAADQLAAFLDKVIAAYDNKTKTQSQYLDLQYLVDGTVLTLTGDKAASTEVIALRFQYSYNLLEEKSQEKTICYLGGANKALTYDHLKILISNLRK